MGCHKGIISGNYDRVKAGTRLWMDDETPTMIGVSQIGSTAMLCSISLYVAPARAELHGEIIDYGETTAEQERPAQRTQDDHSLVPRTTIEGIRYVEHTSSLPAQLCLRFGVTIRLRSDAGEQLPSQLIVVVTHPRITRPDHVFSTQDSFPTPVFSAIAYAGWTFDGRRQHVGCGGTLLHGPPAQ